MIQQNSKHQPSDETVEKPPIKAILLDMDGVLYHGDKAIEDAIGFMQQIKNVPHCFITNNPIRLPTQICDRLESQGFERPATHQIITSGEATADWLAQSSPGFRYFAIGAAGLHSVLSQKGTPDSENADFVVIGEGPGIDYDSLVVAINLIVKNGAKLVCTNPDQSVDATINKRHRILPGGGALVAPLVAATGQQPLIIGKPEPLLYEMALQKLSNARGLKLAAQDCLMIGDRPDTDILGAQRLGMQTALVRTGRFAPDEPLPKDIRPDWDVLTLSELLQHLKLN